YSTKSTEDQEKNLISIHQNQVSSKISIILTNFALAIRIHELPFKELLCGFSWATTFLKKHQK
ncbi:MAG: hypothetical protein SPL28_08770, partial [Bacteroidales bacterium]|nr:hypothetical protein [Bacteroidales bacterium]